MAYVEVTSTDHGRLSLKAKPELWFYATIALPLMVMTYMLVWVWSISKHWRVQQKGLVANCDGPEYEDESVRNWKL